MQNPAFLFTYFGLGFLACKVGIGMLPIFESCCETGQVIYVVPRRGLGLCERSYLL